MHFEIRERRVYARRPPEMSPNAALRAIAATPQPPHPWPMRVAIISGMAAAATRQISAK
jgi:hypothetical protein